MAQVRLEGITKRFGKVKAVAGIDLTIRDHEFLVLLGPSGCGKTTTLRCIAGLEPVDEGRLFIGEREVTDLPAGRRHIGMVFQSYALFPHMTVLDNIAFGLRIQRVPRNEIESRVRRTAELLQLSSLLDRYPAQLSGGQRQRVAVARALVIEPQVLLMDEPLSNLDALLRLQMRAEIKRLHKEIRSTTVYVTHDQVEALSLGDRIAVMKDGEVVQCDDPQAVYDEPASVFVGSFIGSPPMNFLSGTVESEGDHLAVCGEGFHIPLDRGWAGALAQLPDRQVTVGIRPESLRVALRPPQEGEPGWIPVRVAVVESLGAHKLLTVEVGEATLLRVTAPPDLTAGWGETAWLRPDPARLRLFHPETGLALAGAAAGTGLADRAAS